MTDDILNEQLAYYRARAREYDVTALGSEDGPVEREMRGIIEAVRAMPRVGSILELACGTGIWTQMLAEKTERMVALDGAPEMIEQNRAKVGERGVDYRVADLFTWEPDGEYDVVFFGFWLSHVPPDKLDRFLDQVARAVKPGGQLWIIDERGGGRQASGPNEGGQYQTRTLSDGRQFNIIKVYYDPEQLRPALGSRGFGDVEISSGEYFFRLVGRKG